jgi:hypothetical protein
MRIHEAQKHTNPTDPDSDPQHCFQEYKKVFGCSLMVAQGTAMPMTAMAGMKVDPSLSTVCFQTHYMYNN